MTLAALGVFGLTERGESPRPTTPSLAPAPSPAPTPAPPALELTVDQPAVEVFRGVERLGLAPLTIDGAPGQSIRLTLKKEGFETLELDERLPDSGAARVKVHMSRHAERIEAPAALTTPRAEGAPDDALDKRPATSAPSDKRPAATAQTRPHQPTSPQPVKAQKKPQRPSPDSPYNTVD